MCDVSLAESRSYKRVIDNLAGSSHMCTGSSALVVPPSTVYEGILLNAEWNKYGTSIYHGDGGERMRCA